MKKIKPGYFLWGLVIGIAIGVALHSIEVGLIFGVVLGTMITFRSARGV